MKLTPSLGDHILRLFSSKGISLYQENELATKIEVKQTYSIRYTGSKELLVTIENKQLPLTDMYFGKQYMQFSEPISYGLTYKKFLKTLDSL